MRSLISLGLIWLLAPWSSFGQQTLSDWQRVRSLATGTALTVQTKAGEGFHGQVVAVTSDSLVIDSDEKGHPGRVNRQRTLAQADIIEIRFYRRGASILAGAGIGVAAGGGLGRVIDASARSNEDKGLATAAFVVLGGVLGALIGRHAVIVKGAKIYVAP